ncbi:MAG: hypothetical protein IKK22_02245, partial [Firmicutes bacterium]|nr:hypothetical protein [Bacillota bacterium]
ADVMTDRGCDRAFTLPPKHRYADMPFDTSDASLTILTETPDTITVRAETATPFALLDREGVWTGLGEFLKAGETKTLIRE